jgi:fimbrial chaperone protein
MTMWKRMKLPGYAAIAVMIAALVATVVHAMTVTPVIVDLTTSGSRMSQVVTIENKYAQPITLEILTQETEYTDEGVKGTGKQTDDLLVFPPQTQIAPGGTQAIRIQYVGDPDLKQSKHYFVTVAQLPVKMPEGQSGVQLLYNFQIVTGVAVAGRKPAISVASAESYQGADDKPRVLLVLRNDADTYGYLSNGSLRITQKNAAGQEIYKKTMTPDEISQEIGFGLIGAGQTRRLKTALVLPETGGSIEAVFTASSR